MTQTADSVRPADGHEVPDPPKDLQTDGGCLPVLHPRSGALLSARHRGRGDGD